MELKLNDSLPSKIPWPDDPGCSEFRIGFVEAGTVPFVLLASHEGSGNTWMRYLVEGMTGVFTGDSYQVMQVLVYVTVYTILIQYKRGKTFRVSVSYL